MPKPAGVFRIVALGGSSTMGAGVDVAFPELLVRKLRAGLPDRRFEMINGGFLAMGSHRVYEVEREAARLDPDLFLIYLGHNEFLEDIAVDPVVLAAEQRGVMQAARRLRLVSVLGRMVGTRTTGTGDSLANSFLGEPDLPLIRSEEQVEARHAFLRLNIARMIEFARSRGIGILIMPAVANPLLIPGNSKHGSGYGKDALRWDILLWEARAAHREGRYQEVVERLHKLEEIDEQFAESHYLLGVSLLALGLTDSARVSSAGPTAWIVAAPAPALRSSRRSSPPAANMTRRPSTCEASSRENSRRNTAASPADRISASSWTTATRRRPVTNSSPPLWPTRSSAAWPGSSLSG